MESYIDGREFNVSLLETVDGPMILPPAELRFVNFPPEKPRIICYRAKWEEDSFESKNSVRSFEFPSGDSSLLEDLRQASLRCWHAFGLRGYARVDFRVDSAGGIWILEVNSNPCISASAGFLAAAAQHGFSSVEVIREIVSTALRG